MCFAFGISTTASKMKNKERKRENMFESLVVFIFKTQITKIKKKNENENAICSRPTL